MTKILLVEDDEFLIDIYVTKFKAEEFEVETVKEGDLVVDKAKEAKPDLILLDIVLPKMSGLDILKKLKEEKNELAKIPVVILTNLGGVEDLKEGMNEGAIDYIVKSQFTPSEVVEKVKEILVKVEKKIN